MLFLVGIAVVIAGCIVGGPLTDLSMAFVSGMGLGALLRADDKTFWGRA